MAMGAAMCGALATLVAMGTLGAIWVGATRCQWPTKCDTSGQFAIFCHWPNCHFLAQKIEIDWLWLAQGPVGVGGGLWAPLPLT